MRLPLCWLGTTTALGLTWGVMAAPPADPAALVSRLGDPAYAVREAAQRELVARGAGALPAVEAAAGHPDPEVRDRAAAVASRLRRLAEQAPLLAAKRVKLDYANRPLADAVADLRTRTGLNIHLDPSVPDAPVTLSTAELPVWEAAEAFRRAAGLREVPPAEFTNPAPASPTGTRQLRTNYYAGPPAVESAGQVPVVWAASDGRPDSEMPADRSTAVRVRALPAGFPGHKVVRGTGQIVLALDVTPPAGMWWAEGATVRLDRAEDEAGRPVAVAQSPLGAEPAGGDADPFAFGVGGGQVLRLNLNAGFRDEWTVEPAAGPRPNPRLVPVALRTDDRTVTRLRVLDGAVVGAVVLPDQPLVVVADLAQAAGTTAVGVTGARLTVTRFEARADGTTAVGLTLKTPAGPADIGRGRWNGNGAWLTGLGQAGAELPRFRTAAGQLVRPHGTTLTNRAVDADGGEQTTYELTFPKGAAPAAVTLVGPRAVAVEVPFRLRDVPLP